MAVAASQQVPIPQPDLVPKSLSQTSDFDILRNYRELLANDSLLTPPIAAIESLITLLSATPPSTVSETLSILSTASNRLKANVANPLPVTAGTDLFQRYIISTLQTRSSTLTKKTSTSRSCSRDRDQTESDDFRPIRAHLLANSRLFVRRAKESRGIIAQNVAGFLGEGVTIATFGLSRVVQAVLDRAAEEGKRFRVVYVEGSLEVKHEAPRKPRSVSLVRELREKGVPVAVIPFENLTSALTKTTFAIVGAESVVESGGVISRMGTHQMALLAKNARKPFYVVAESYKFVRVYPLDEQDTRVRGQVDLEFLTEDREHGGEDAGTESGDGGEAKAVDFTPPELITALITESGVQTPSAVSEELIKIWD